MTIARTSHVVIRCGERGFRETDLDLIARYGTVTDGGFMLTRNNVMEFERQIKKRLDRLSKLQGAFVATSADGGTAKTVFRPTRKQRRRQVGCW